ncbi:MAG: glycoside hydrolase [Spirochaetaceae bacterium]|jgi:spore germination protein YaaH|nr:glycoside hydrolase [Spirochaetaceae bacterium]
MKFQPAAFLSAFFTLSLCAFSILVSCKTAPVPITDVPDDIPPEDEPVEEAVGVEEEEFAGFDFIADDLASLPKSEFAEVWGYVVARNEKSLKPGYPVSDVVYFGAEVDQYGTIVNIPNRKTLPRSNARVHVSIVCGSGGLTHFLLEPESRARSNFLKALIAMARDYDGLNIDMELVPLQDAANFLSLLQELKNTLDGKILSVCVPARDSESRTYNYNNIAKIADKVFVMAYDEHWSGSSPGPVASMKWCKNVAAYALKTIGAKKLVMGIPFYGRSWANTSTARALIASTTDTLIKNQNVERIDRESGVPKFTYSVDVKVTVYFEDAYSIAARMDMYRNMGVNKIGFWRIGQEDTAVWNYIKISPTTE